MSERVYIETSVVSYLAARQSNNVLAAARQQMTREWWGARRTRFALFVSELVIAEASRGDPDAAEQRVRLLDGIPNLVVTPSVVTLAKRLVAAGALPERAIDDAMHVALAAVHDMDYLLTWNCRHLDNAELKPRVRRTCEDSGYSCPEICTPQELMGESEDV